MTKIAEARSLHFIAVPLLLACALLAPCHSNAETGDPVDVAVRFFEAGKAWRCDEAWRFYSAGTQENFLAEDHRYEREREGPSRPDTVQKRHCGWTSNTLKPGTVRIARQQGDEAVVAADFIGKAPRNRHDIFFPPSVVTTKELRLVREAGEWRVEQPRLPIGRPGWRLIEVGPVDVFQEPRPPAGLLRKLEATAVSRVPRDTLDSALHDPQFWTHALPSVSAAEPLERTGELDRVRLAFAVEPERSLTVTVTLSGKPVDATREWTTLQWNVEDGNKAPVYFRGSVTLRPHHDGTRVTMELVVDPKQWPGDVAEGAFSAQHMAQALLGLDKVALGSAR